jgi:hypothetical protein
MRYSRELPSYSPYVLFSIPSVYCRDVQVTQAAKDVSASCEALVDLFALFENFLNRLRIYTGIAPVPALTSILVKIMVELMSTLALATKQVKQGRFSEFVLAGNTLDSIRHRGVYEDASWRERH